MITKLLLTNFKSHADTKLDLKKLTIIAGVNNCGKSSILQSLLLLRQSNSKNRLQFGLDLNEPLTSIGTGNDVLYKLSESPLIGISVCYDHKELSFSFNAENALSDTFVPLVEGCESFSQDEFKKYSLFNTHFQYLSAERWGGRSEYPSDTYAVNVERQLSIKCGRGEMLGNFLFENKRLDTYDYWEGSGKMLPLLEQVSVWGNRISANLTIDVQQKEDKNGFSVLFGTRGTNGTKNIEGLKANNVGYGVSYSLPIIVALLSAEPGSLILIENPEAHLHQDGISELTRLMCLAAERGVQIVVETHSDHVINGTLVNCKKFEKGERGICRDNVSMYYISGQDEKHASKVEKVEIEEGGYLNYQPKGFFDRIETDRFYIIGE